MWDGGKFPTKFPVPGCGKFWGTGEIPRGNPSFDFEELLLDKNQLQTKYSARQE